MLQMPEGGFGAWNETLWGNITNVGTTDSTPNKYGITLNWGDTVGGMNGDGLGETGSAAERSYGQAGRLIKNYTITVDGAAYDMNFAAAPIPEPGTFALLAMAGMGLLAYAWRRRRS